MKEITNNFIEEVEKDYINNDIYTIARHALSKNEISDIAKVNEQTEFTRNRFSIDLKTLRSYKSKV